MSFRVIYGASPSEEISSVSPKAAGTLSSSGEEASSIEFKIVRDVPIFGRRISPFRQGSLLGGDVLITVRLRPVTGVTGVTGVSHGSILRPTPPSRIEASDDDPTPTGSLAVAA
jgi:hypothetical protein